jgi:hypothetical protein
MQREDVQVRRRDERRPSRRGILLGLLPLTLLAAALLAAPAQADPQFSDGCKVQLTGQAGPPNPPQPPAQLTWNCTTPTGNIKTIDITSSSGKQIIAGPDQQGQGLCLPSGADAATCNYNPTSGAAAGAIPILANDPCGADDNDPLVFDLTLTGTGTEPPTVDFTGLQIQCAGAPPPGGTPPPTGTTGTPTSAPGVPSGGGGGVAGTGAGGGGQGVSGAQDNGQAPVGGVQSGAGGTATADDGGPGLLAAAVGLMLAAALAMGIARVRSVKE